MRGLRQSLARHRGLRPGVLTPPAVFAGPFRGLRALRTLGLLAAFAAAALAGLAGCSGRDLHPAVQGAVWLQLRGGEFQPGGGPGRGSARGPSAVDGPVTGGGLGVSGRHPLLRGERLWSRLLREGFLRHAAVCLPRGSAHLRPSHHHDADPAPGIDGSPPLLQRAPERRAPAGPLDRGDQPRFLRPAAGRLFVSHPAVPEEEPRLGSRRVCRRVGEQLRLRVEVHRCVRDAVRVHALSRGYQRGGDGEPGHVPGRARGARHRGP